MIILLYLVKKVLKHFTTNIISNDQIENEIMNVCNAEKITVERLDNGQNSVYFLNLNKPTKKKKKKAEDESNV